METDNNKQKWKITEEMINSEKQGKICRWNLIKVRNTWVILLIDIHDHS